MDGILDGIITQAGVTDGTATAEVDHLSLLVSAHHIEVTDHTEDSETHGDGAVLGVDQPTDMDTVDLEMDTIVDLEAKLEDTGGQLVTHVIQHSIVEIEWLHQQETIIHTLVLEEERRLDLQVLLEQEGMVNL